MSVERTLSIIKPDAVAKNVIGEIYSRFEKAGLKVVEARMQHLSREEAEGFYAVHRERPFFNDLVEFMTSGPVMIQALEGEDAIALNRKLMGATNPAEAEPGTIRADFAQSIDANAVHGSDGPDTAKTEIAYFFWRLKVTGNQNTVNAIASRLNLLDFDEAGLRDFFVSIGEKPFRAQQILKWVYHHAVTDFEAMTDLGIALRQKLNLIAEIKLPVVLQEQRSKDGTVKWLIGFHGGNAVETVYIPEPKRGTLCVSSQVGCALNCSFCSTGAQGFARNLTTSEIIGQVWLAAQALGHERNGLRKITNIVMMGMGEPLLNFDAVLPALSVMRSDLGFGFAAKRVTVSTAGLVPGIYGLREAIDVALAVSLHSPVDEVRTELVPLNRKYPIAELMQACRDFVSEKHKRTVTFEYTLIDGVNDHPEHARKLVKLLRTVPSKLNLIPFNPFPGTQYRCSSQDRIKRFQEIVMQGDLIATVRKTRGEDIDAACGQLVGKVQDRTKRSERIKIKMAESTP